MRHPVKYSRRSGVGCDARRLNGPWRYFYPAVRLIERRLRSFHSSISADAATGADGITQGLIKNLSRLPKLRVRPLASVLKYRVNAQLLAPDLRVVGQDLNVPVILTGRVERRSGGLSIDIELIDARNNSYIWGRKYDRNLSELLALDGLRVKFPSS